MADHATPNLPSRHYDDTIAFYAKLGFTVRWHDSGWLIMENSGLVLEFFRYPDIDPATSSFGCCLRLDDVHVFYETCRSAGIAEKTTGFPRLRPPKREDSGMTIGYLVDPDGSLLRLVQNSDDE